jgi:hypothetical protein
MLHSAAVLHRNHYGAGCGNKPTLLGVLYLFEDRPFRTLNDGNKCWIFGSDIADGTNSSRQTEGLLDQIVAASLSFLQTNNGLLEILSHTSVSGLHIQ